MMETRTGSDDVPCIVVSHRKAAAAVFGLSERSDQMWAYNKTTAGTGGLAAILGRSVPGLREASARLLGSLVSPWPSPEFTAALEGIAILLIEASTNAFRKNVFAFDCLALEQLYLVQCHSGAPHPRQESNGGFYKRARDVSSSTSRR